MIRCCSYCEHYYPFAVFSDFHSLVHDHVREHHPDKWRMVKPGDEWTKRDDRGLPYGYDDFEERQV
jgi:hypothetical protein